MPAISKRKDGPVEPFKRALAAATRSIAGDQSLQVVFGADPPGLQSGIARLPEPARVPTQSELAAIRGHADSMALKTACHDAKLHRRIAPSTGPARAVFEAVERARVEAIGARRMKGMALNLNAKTESLYARTAGITRAPNGGDRLIGITVPTSLDRKIIIVDLRGRGPLETHLRDALEHRSDDLAAGQSAALGV